MKRLLSTLAALCALAVSARAALPEAGTYSGMLNMTKQVFGTTVKYNVRAMAEIAPDGSLKIMLLTTPSPLLLAQPEIALETTILPNGSCIVPQAPKPPAPPAPTPPDPLPGTINIGPILLPTPIYWGFVQASTNMFTLTYDDVPDDYIYPPGPRPIEERLPIGPSAVYKFSFRKVTAAGIKISVY